MERLFFLLDSLNLKMYCGEKEYKLFSIMKNTLKSSPLYSSEELKQLNLAKSIFAGVKRDKDDYCACPKCGSRNLLHDGHALDDGYISCLDCYYSISGSDPYEMIRRWNMKCRDSFQLKIIFNF